MADVPLTESDEVTIADSAGVNKLAVSAAGAASVDASATTVLPLPTGAATSTNQTTGNASVASIDTKTPTVGQKVMANSRPIVIASDQSAVPISGTISANLAGYSYSSYSPDPSNYATSNNTNLDIDAAGRLEVHATATTDEGSFRDDFSGSSLAATLTGTLNFTNGLSTIQGVGTSFTTQLVSGQWIKKSTDSETLYVQIDHVSNDTNVFIVTPYTGTTASGVTGVVSNWKTTTGVGGSLSVASSNLTIASGTTSGSATSIQRPGDYLPYTVQAYMSISQRIANQTAFLGFVDQTVGATKQAIVQFTGTTNTQVSFITAFSSAAADIQTTVVTLPNGGTTATSHLYKIDISSNACVLSIDGVVVAYQNLHIPGPYDSLVIAAQISNAAVVTTTSLIIDSIGFSNWDRLQIDSDFSGEPIPVSSQSSPLWVTATGAAAAAVTVTLPAVTTQFHYISHIEIEAYSSAARTGGATPVIVTSTNLPGSPAWTFATAAAIGTTDTKLYSLGYAIKSLVSNTATTIVCPATTGVIWRVNVSYYLGS